MSMAEYIYVDNYNDYLVLRKWIMENKFKCPNGMVIDASEDLLNYNEEDFNGGEKLPILYDTWALDYFLIKYCSIGYVRDYLKGIYGEDYFQDVLNGKSIFDTFTYSYGKNKVIVKYLYKKKNKLWKYPHENPKINKKYKGEFIIHVMFHNEDMYYSEKYDKYTLPSKELGIWDSNLTCCCHSVKALIRKIRKWKLPKGAIIKAYGWYNVEEYEFKVK